jgi:hypothetical protein
MVVPSFDMELRFSMVNFPVLSLFTTYHRVCNWINTTGVTSEAETAYPAGSPEFTRGV